MRSPKSRRLFIALGLSDGLILHLDEFAKSLRDEGFPKIRWVKPQNIHLTLKFLGDTSESLVQSINSSVNTSTSGVAPFTIQVHGLGGFPHLRAPRTLWLGIHGNLQPLVHIKDRLEHTLETEGFPKDPTKFTPHLTLGRVNRRLISQDREIIKQVAVKLEESAPRNMVVSKISLIESRLNRNGVDYIPLQEHLLEG